jgi:hypothetical protein
MPQKSIALSRLTSQAEQIAAGFSVMYCSVQHFISKEIYTTVHAIYLHKNILVKVALAAMTVP